jgi:hypothetical protein
MNRSKQDGTGLILEEEEERKDYSYGIKLGNSIG